MLRCTVVLEVEAGETADQIVRELEEDNDMLVQLPSLNSRATMLYISVLPIWDRHLVNASTSLVAPGIPGTILEDFDPQHMFACLTNDDCT